MHARVTILTGGSPDRIDSGIADFRENVAPWVREQGGRGAIMLVDRQAGNGMAITLWEDEEAMRASDQRADELRRDAAEGMGAAEAPRVERYEVAVFET
jgi:hypothetical protein